MTRDQLFEQIRMCKGIDECWGKILPPIDPVVVPYLGKPDVMLVTEQRPPACDKSLLDDLIDIKRRKTLTRKRSSRGIVTKLDDFFEPMGGLLNDLDEDQGGFHRFYWTHFIKCSGDIRKKTKKPKLKACADHWLMQEIEVARPKILVTFGAYASRWFLTRVGYAKDWKERIWEEFTAIIENKTLPKVSLNGLQLDLIVAPHPSGVSTLGWFNEKLSKLLTRWK